MANTNEATNVSPYINQGIVFDLSQYAGRLGRVRAIRFHDVGENAARLLEIRFIDGSIEYVLSEDVDPVGLSESPLCYYEIVIVNPGPFIKRRSNSACRSIGSCLRDWPGGRR